MAHATPPKFEETLLTCEVAEKYTGRHAFGPLAKGEIRKVDKKVHTVMFHGNTNSDLSAIGSPLSKEMVPEPMQVNQP